MRIGLLVNPIAGMGGPVALRGTDDSVDEARARGAVPVAEARAVRFLARLAPEVRVATVSGTMGASPCAGAGRAAEVVLAVDEPTSAEDTVRAARELLGSGVSILCFVGGDGTARDVARAIGHDVPCLGVPSGVKMNSGCFADGPEAAADVVRAFLEGRAEARVVEVVEVDEAAVRAGELAPARLASLLVPGAERVAGSKAEAGGSLEGLCQAVEDLAEPGATLVLGPGGTLHAIKVALAGEGTLLGVDVVVVDGHGKPALAARDATARELEAVPETARLVVSPIGGQGFVVGRGNQQVVPGLLRRLGWEGLVVVATPEKLDGLRVLRADTGDPALDAEAPAHLRVVTGPGFERLVRLQGNPGS